jgi:hypothetical protein
MAALPPWPMLAATSLMRIGLVLALLTVALPWLIFPERLDRASSPWLARALWFTFAATVAVHLLVAIRLYEAIVCLALGLIAAVWRRVWGMPWVDRHHSTARFLGWLFDRLDGKPHAVAAQAEPAAPPVQVRRKAAPWAWTAALVLTAVLGVASWILFASTFTTMAPPYSDAPVNLAWLKYLENNDLYHWNYGEVYPRGMYAALSLIAKLTALNGVLVLDIAGPLIGLGIVLALLFFVHRTTRSMGAVIFTAVLYGTQPGLITRLYERHAAPNSQEYGLMFVLPAAWFVFTYLRDGRRADRTSAAAAAGVAAFTHPVPALFAVIAMGGAGLVALLDQGRAAWRRLPGLVGWVGGAGAIAALPPVAALLLGQQWHGSSVAYLQATTNAPPPIVWWQLGLMGAALLLIPISLVCKLAPQAAAAAVVALALFINQLPALGVRSQALGDRAEAIGALGLAIAAGLAWALLERLLGRWRQAGVIPAAAIAAVSCVLLPPAPVHPYRYYADEMIAYYLRADAAYPAGTWTLVTEATTGYALAVGRSLHLTPDQFIALAERMPPDPADWYEADHRSSTHTLTAHYVLMLERRVPLAPDQPESAAAPRLAESARLSQWLLTHQAVLPVRWVFSDPALDVWTLEVPFPLATAGR